MYEYEYGFHSGYKINITKTQIFLTNYSPSKRRKRNYKLKWDAKLIKYLGVNVTKRPKHLFEANYTKINQDVRRNLERWSILNTR